MAGTMLLASSAFAQGKLTHDANYVDLTPSSPQAIAIINESGVVGALDGSSVIAAHPNGRKTVLDGKVDRTVVGFSGGRRGKVKDIRLNPMGRVPLRWMAPEVIGLCADWSWGATNSQAAEEVSGLVAWNPNVGPILFSVCNFKMKLKFSIEFSALVADASENGRWACGAKSSLLFNPKEYSLLRYGNLFDGSSTDVGFPVTFARRKDGAIVFADYNMMRCNQTGGAYFQAFDASSSVNGLLKAHQDTIQLASSRVGKIEDLVLKQMTPCGNGVCGVDQDGALAFIGPTSWTITPTPDMVFDGPVACSAGGYIAVATSSRKGGWDVATIKGSRTKTQGDFNLSHRAFTPDKPGAFLVNDNDSVCFSLPPSAVSKGESLAIDNGPQTVQVLSVGQPLFGSVLSSFSIAPEHNFNNHDACAVTYVLDDGRSGIMTVSLNAPIVRGFAGPSLKSSGHAQEFTLVGEKFVYIPEAGGGPHVKAFRPGGADVVLTVVKSSSRRVRVVVPDELLTTPGDIIFEVTNYDSTVRGKQYVGHVTLIK